MKALLIAKNLVAQKCKQKYGQNSFQPNKNKDQYGEISAKYQISSLRLG